MGLFVTLEGPEGSGKTTQINLLEEALTALGYHVVCTREPGGTEVGKQIRALLLDARNAALVPEAEILLYSADRAQHVAEKVRPALDKGAIVISDRYAESTFAYQGYGRGLDMEMLSDITRLATGGLQPDLVIYLDLPVEDGLARKHKEHIKGTGEWNRMDDQTSRWPNAPRKGGCGWMPASRSRCSIAR